MERKMDAEAVMMGDLILHDGNYTAVRDVWNRGDGMIEIVIENGKILTFHAYDTVSVRIIAC